CPHQLQRAARACKACFRVIDYRGEPVNLSVTAQVLYLIGSLESLIDSLHETRNPVGRVETSIRVGLAVKVSVRRYLPAAHVDGFQAGLNYLKCLDPGKST